MNAWAKLLVVSYSPDIAGHQMAKRDTYTVGAGDLHQDENSSKTASACVAYMTGGAPPIYTAVSSKSSNSARDAQEHGV